MTERLYYADSHLFDFTAKVLKIINCGEKNAVILDRTAFFPEGGGQLGDNGYIAETKIIDVQIKDGEVFHYFSGDSSFCIGDSVPCKVDGTIRIERMQAHSGEHIVSGLVHTLFGFENVGFHMDGLLMTVDFNGYLNAEQLKLVETKANECVYKNIKIQTFFPSAEELKSTEYRSKLELSGEVRLVKIPGYDCCACCAPHVLRTGEIGVIKILTFVSHRGGVRITLVCGAEAFRNLSQKYDNTLVIADMLCAKHNETDLAVKALCERYDELKKKMGEQKAILTDCIYDSCLDNQKNIVMFYNGLNSADLGEIALKCSKKTDGICAVMSGDDSTGYSFALSCRSASPVTFIKQINAELSGRGGGKDNLVQGRFCASRQKIQAYLSTFEVPVK